MRDLAGNGRLKRSFFERYTPDVARELVGSSLVRVVGERRVTGIVVETEAYRGPRDPASHAHRGVTHRNIVMFGPPGFAYVYFTMGVHYCLNVSTEAVGSPGAVLLRAVQPVDGIDVMSENRGVDDIRRLASGPGNLAKAFAVDGAFNGEDLVNSDRLYFERGKAVGPVRATARVGVAEARSRPWRYYVRGSPFVSRGRPSWPQNP